MKSDIACLVSACFILATISFTVDCETFCSVSSNASSFSQASLSCFVRRPSKIPATDVANICYIRRTWWYSYSFIFSYFLIFWQDRPRAEKQVVINRWLPLANSTMSFSVAIPAIDAESAMATAARTMSRRRETLILPLWCKMPRINTPIAMQ